MNTNKPPVESVMSYAQSPPLAEDEWFTDPVSTDAPLRNQDTRSDRRIPQRRTATVNAQHAFGRKGVHEMVERPSAVGRFIRTLFRFVIAVSIGVGGTIAAQTDTAKEMLAAYAPTLAWVLSVSPAKSVSAAPSLGVAAPAQQAGPSAADLDAVRRSVDQLAARQDQMAQSMAALQAVGEDIRQKVSSTPPPPLSPPREAAAIPQPKPPQARAPSPAAQAASAPRLAPPPGSPVPSR
jgi:hypothetical protein